MTALWRHVLECEVQPFNDFFADLGGDSLLAIELVENVEVLVGFPVELEALFEHSTPEKLLRELEESRSGSANA